MRCSLSQCHDVSSLRSFTIQVDFGEMDIDVARKAS